MISTLPFFQDDRRVTQEENEVEYQQALVTVKEKIRHVEGPDMKEMMQDQIRQWFIECRWVTFVASHTEVLGCAT